MGRGREAQLLDGVGFLGVMSDSKGSWTVSTGCDLRVD
jgi:hypothetical protein